MKKCQVILVIIALLFSFIPTTTIAATTKITVTATKEYYPGYIWCQHQNGDWSTWSEIDGYKYASDAGGEPALTKVRNFAILEHPKAWKDNQNKQYSLSEVKNIQHVFDGEYPRMGDTADSKIQGSFGMEDGKLIIEGYTGKGIYKLNGTDACGGNNGVNYPFPIVVKWQGEIEVTTTEATAHIMHFTEKGQSLNSVFGDSQETLEEGISYSFKHPTDNDYIYKGYKIKEGVPPSGSTKNGDPPSFTYDGSYDKLYVYFYYEKKGGGDPDPDPEPNGPIAAFRYTPSSPKANQNVSFKDESTHPDGLDIVKWEWNIDGTKSMKQHPTYTFPKEGKYNVTLKVTDENGKTDSITHPVTVDLPNLPPKVNIRGEDTVYVGDTEYYRANASDPDGYIAMYEWDMSGDSEDKMKFISDTDGQRVKIEFLQEGETELYVGVEDNRGEYAWDTETITILPPIPIADISSSGDFKVNRKITIDSKDSWSPDSFPLDHSKTKWTITPVEGQDNNSIKYIGSLNSVSKKDTLYKETGRYKVTLYVENTAGYSDTDEAIIEIYPDEPPVALFDTSKTVLREITDGNAHIEMTDNSYSPDGDSIAKRLWYYRFDKDNDGNFEEEVWKTFSDQNEENPELIQEHVGKYESYHEVFEADFDDPFVSQFVTKDEVLSDTSAIERIEVINIAPAISLEATNQKKVKLIVEVGDTTYSKADVEAKINDTVIPALVSKGMDVSAVVEKTPTRPVKEMVADARGRINSWYKNFKGVTGDYFVFGRYYYNPKTNKSDGFESFVGGGYDEVLRNSLYIYGDGYKHYDDDGEKFRFLTRQYIPSGSDGGYWFGGNRYDEDDSLYLNSYTNQKGNLVWSYELRSSSKKNGIYDRYDHPSSGDDPLIKGEFRYVGIDESNKYIFYTKDYDTYDRIYMYDRETENSTRSSHSGRILEVTNDYLYYKDNNGGELQNMIRRWNFKTNESNIVMSYDDATHLNLNSPLTDVEEKWLYYKKDGLRRVSLETGKKEMVHPDAASYYIGVDGAYITTDNGLVVYKAHRSNSVDLTKIKDIKVNDEELIVVPIDDKKIYDFTDPKVKEEVNQSILDHRGYYFPIGKAATNKTQHQSILKINNGTFIENTNLDAVMNTLRDEIIAAIYTPPSNATYITLDESAEYLLNYIDRENDPKFNESYTYVHDPHVFDNSMGISKYHNVTRTSPVETFDVKGLFQIKAKAQDNPVGDDLHFVDYRLWSNESIANIYVHERPVAKIDYTIYENPDKSWEDFISLDGSASYDPDYIFSRSDKGIAEEEWMWREIKWDDGEIIEYGDWNKGKIPDKHVLDRWSQYTVSLRVKDIHGAWSEPDIQILEHTKFKAGFTLFPKVGYIDTDINVMNLAYHEEGEELDIWYYLFKKDENGDYQRYQVGNYPWQNTIYEEDWTRVFEDRGDYKVTQSVRYEDEDGDYEYKNEDDYFIIINRPPTVEITNPSSNDDKNPTIFDDIPTFAWDFIDQDNDPQAKFRIKVYNYNNDLVKDSGEVSAANDTWFPSQLPEDTPLFVIAEVYDGYDWSQSSPKYFFIKGNDAPIADFTWNPTEPWEGDTIQLIDQSNDPDGDPLEYDWKIINPNNVDEYSSQQNPVITNAITGTYTVTLTVTDPDGETDSVKKNIFVNSNFLAIDIKHSTVEIYPSTTSWEDLRIERNRQEAVFWAGEPFLSVASTSSNAKDVQVSFDFPKAEYKISEIYSSEPYPDFAGTINLTSTNDINWSGKYGNGLQYYFIPDGNYNITFTATYENGTQKSLIYNLVIQDSGLPVIALIK
ncbi:PKD domain-containing protein [Longirhabdus pacifica]|uniref:PKD domain-containing protein n=1 Tax=Longirhabdus pacifica TaxID=2305227 RepID=UPI001008B096|nr:PKD domain-containing protein [Longirhabdus pacifica]